MFEQDTRLPHSGDDRKDQAIGRLARLLPMLTVKELDSLEDRIRQRLPGPVDILSAITSDAVARSKSARIPQAGHSSHTSV